MFINVCEAVTVGMKYHKNVFKDLAALSYSASDNCSVNKAEAIK